MTNTPDGGDPRDPSAAPRPSADPHEPPSAGPDSAAWEPTQKASVSESETCSVPVSSAPGAVPEGTEVPDSHSPADDVTRVIRTGGAPPGGSDGPVQPPAGGPPAGAGPPPSAYGSTRVISTRPPAGPSPQAGRPHAGPTPRPAPPGRHQPGPGRPPGYGPPPGHGQPGAPMRGQPAQQPYSQPSPAPSPAQHVPPQDAPPQDGAGGSSTNTLAIVALVASLLGLVCSGLGGLVGLVLGVVARKQIAASHGTQTGDGVALTAVIIGAFVVVVWVAYWLVVVLTEARTPWDYF
ncbi:DUF4190 domain-containing protein [Gordonia terrae]|uniref:DUF4190 domain-containing protein n=1 Tax=Gordonia terrae TaxID=2055 RepID=UPI003F6BD7C8